MAGGMPHDHAKRQYREAARVWGRCDGFVAKHMGDGSVAHSGNDAYSPGAMAFP
jgi:hypothetical protein